MYNNFLIYVNFISCVNTITKAFYLPSSTRFHKDDSTKYL
jgi:hypothetical protein